MPALIATDISADSSPVQQTFIATYISSDRSAILTSNGTSFVAAYQQTVEPTIL